MYVYVCVCVCAYIYMPGHTRVSKFEAASRVVVGEPRAERSSSDLVMSLRDPNPEVRV